MTYGPITREELLDRLANATPQPLTFDQIRERLREIQSLPTAAEREMAMAALLEEHKAGYRAAEHVALRALQHNLVGAAFALGLVGVIFGFGAIVFALFN